MKSIVYLLVAFIAFLISSCSSVFYQLYKTESNSNLILKDGNLVYEDENCKIFYNLWSDKGNPGFRFYNKTDDDIYINMPESYFILNGLAYNYYKERVYTHSGGGSVQVVSYYFGLGVSSTNNVSISKKEEDIICIPAMTSKIITEYDIVESPIKFCDYKEYPSSTSKINSLYFTKENTPLKFSNRITYWVGKMGGSVKIINEFIVTELTNYHSSKFVTKQTKDECGEKLLPYKEVFKYPSPDKFFIMYTSSNK